MSKRFSLFSFLIVSLLFGKTGFAAGGWGDYHNEAGSSVSDTFEMRMATMRPHVARWIGSSAREKGLMENPDFVQLASGHLLINKLYHNATKVEGEIRKAAPQTIEGYSTIDSELGNVIRGQVNYMHGLLCASEDAVNLWKDKIMGKGAYSNTKWAVSTRDKNLTPEEEKKFFSSVDKTGVFDNNIGPCDDSLDPISYFCSHYFRAPSTNIVPDSSLSENVESTTTTTTSTTVVTVEKPAPFQENDVRLVGVAMADIIKNNGRMLRDLFDDPDTAFNLLRADDDLKDIDDEKLKRVIKYIVFLEID